MLVVWNLQRLSDNERGEGGEGRGEERRGGGSHTNSSLFLFPTIHLLNAFFLPPSLSLSLSLSLSRESVWLTDFSQSNPKLPEVARGKNCAATDAENSRSKTVLFEIPYAGAAVVAMPTKGSI